MKNNNIVILYSGDASDSTSADNQDTLIQLQEISTILEAEGYQITPLAFTGSLDKISATIENIKPQCIFNLVETVKNTDRLLYTAAAFIEYLGYKYTGCPAWSIAALAKKTTTKKILLSAGLPTPEFILFGQTSPAQASSRGLTTGSSINTWIIKPDTEHASFGLDSNSIVAKKTPDEIMNLLTAKHQNNNYEWFAEHFIAGREFNVSIIDNGHGQPHVLTPVEMTFSTDGKSQQQIGDNIIDYAAKWASGDDHHDPFERRFSFDAKDDALLANIKEICQSCWELFGLKGAARIDLRVDKDNKPWIVDVNPNPCLAADAGLIAAAQNLAGLSQKDLILKLINTV